MNWKLIDAVDVTVAGGFACVVAGVALRYDGALALIVLGLGLIAVGVFALWRRG